MMRKKTLSNEVIFHKMTRHERNDLAKQLLDAEWKAHVARAVGGPKWDAQTPERFLSEFLTLTAVIFPDKMVAGVVAAYQKR